MNWLKLNCQSSKNNCISSIEWSILFSFALWSLWLHQNSIAFERAHSHLDLKAETLAKATEFFYIGINGKQIWTKQKIQVRWLCPLPNWFKLNIDGSSLDNPGLAGGGGLIRNEKGEWVKGFARAIETTTSVAAELWALRDGIRLCIALKLPTMVIELDSKLVVDLLKKVELWVKLLLKYRIFRCEKERKVTHSKKEKEKEKILLSYEIQDCKPCNRREKIISYSLIYGNLKSRSK